MYNLVTRWVKIDLKPSLKSSVLKFQNSYIQGVLLLVAKNDTSKLNLSRQMEKLLTKFRSEVWVEVWVCGYGKH